MLDRLKAPKGAVKNKKRVGRGEGSGSGKTSGRGGKGQTARSGGSIKPGFEGGQMPLQRRLPKRGFNNKSRVVNRIVNLCDIAVNYQAGEVVDEVSLFERGILKEKRGLVKVLGKGELNIPLTVRVDLYSEAAIEKIKAAGGVAEVI